LGRRISLKIVARHSFGENLPERESHCGPGRMPGVP
jgi:hypothetical protein